MWYYNSVWKYDFWSQKQIYSGWIFLQIWIGIQFLFTPWTLTNVHVYTILQNCSLCFHNFVKVCKMMHICLNIYIRSNMFWQIEMQISSVHIMRTKKLIYLSWKITQIQIWIYLCLQKGQIQTQIWIFVLVFKNENTNM